MRGFLHAGDGFLLVERGKLDDRLDDEFHGVLVVVVEQDLPHRQVPGGLALRGDLAGALGLGRGGAAVLAGPAARAVGPGGLFLLVVWHTHRLHSNSRGGSVLTSGAPRPLANNNELLFDPRLYRPPAPRLNRGMVIVRRDFRPARHFRPTRLGRYSGARWARRGRASD
jgi:hypothetical protein